MDRENRTKKMLTLIHSNFSCLFTSQHKNNKLNTYKEQPEGSAAAWSLEGTMSHVSWLSHTTTMTVLAQAFRNVIVTGLML